MKIILDESTPQKLRLLIDSRHVVVTTWFQGWSGLKNGALLAAARKLALAYSSPLTKKSVTNKTWPGVESRCWF